MKQWYVDVDNRIITDERISSEFYPLGVYQKHLIDKFCQENRYKLIAS